MSFFNRSSSFITNLSVHDSCVRSLWKWIHLLPLSNLPEPPSIKAPSTRIRFRLKTEIFPSALTYCPHVFDENGHQKKNFSKTYYTLSRVEILNNAGFSFPCGRTRTEVFEYDDIIHHLLLVRRMLCEECYRIPIIKRFRINGRKRFDYVTSGRLFLWKRRGKISVLTNIWIRVDRA